MPTCAKVTLVLFTVVYVIGLCHALQCYKCSVTIEKYYSRDMNSTLTSPMCSKFDKSLDFITECPYSTMCLKTITALLLQNGERRETTTRGCAQQKDTTQVFRSNHWQQEHSIQEVYTEGCAEIASNFFSGPKLTHCYCRGGLCNSGSNVFATKSFLAILVICFLKICFC